MTERPDSFKVFLRQVQAGWHIYSALGAMSVFLIFAAADAHTAINNQGSRLTVVEDKVATESDRIATIEERSRLTLQYVQQIDSKLDQLLQERR